MPLFHCMVLLNFTHSFLVFHQQSCALCLVPSEFKHCRPLIVPSESSLARHGAFGTKLRFLNSIKLRRTLRSADVLCLVTLLTLLWYFRRLCHGNQLIILPTMRKQSAVRNGYSLRFRGVLTMAVFDSSKMALIGDCRQFP